MVAIRCPCGFDHLMRKAGGQWERGTRRWLIERRRIGPVIRSLQRARGKKEAPDISRAELRREPIELQRKRPAVVPALSVSI
jgi:hypothetical protein